MLFKLADRFKLIALGDIASHRVRLYDKDGNKIDNCVAYNADTSIATLLTLKPKPRAVLEDECCEAMVQELIKETPFAEPIHEDVHLPGSYIVIGGE